jgi:hypothetical protein
MIITSVAGACTGQDLGSEFGRASGHDLNTHPGRFLQDN